MKPTRVWAIALGWSALTSLAVTFALAVLGRPSLHMVLTTLATALVYALSIGVPATIALPLMMRGLQGRPLWFRTLISLVTSAVLSVPGSLIGVSLLVVLGLVPAEDRWTRWQGDARIALLISLAIGIASAVYGRFRARLEETELELKTQELARERAEKLASEAQLASLASRLQPHFLFNTLNSISSLIRIDPVRAERILGRFSALLRFSLDAREGDLVSLEREMKLVADYLEIQHTRFAQRLTYELDVPPRFLEHRVPPFSVQTLVENSVKYAVGPSPEGSTIRVVAQVQDGRLCLEVWDDGPGFTAEQVRPNHGIDNLRERLGAIYGEGARLAIGRGRFRAQGPELTRVALELPLGEGAVS